MTINPLAKAERDHYERLKAWEAARLEYNRVDGLAVKYVDVLNEAKEREDDAFRRALAKTVGG